MKLLFNLKFTFKNSGLNSFHFKLFKFLSSEKNIPKCSPQYDVYNINVYIHLYISMKHLNPIMSLFLHDTNNQPHKKFNRKCLCFVCIYFNALPLNFPIVYFYRNGLIFVFLI